MQVKKSDYNLKTDRRYNREIVQFTYTKITGVLSNRLEPSFTSSALRRIKVKT